LRILDSSTASAFFPPKRKVFPLPLPPPEKLRGNQKRENLPELFKQDLNIN